MTIQLPVLIWTVICFCVLMLILDRLLFKPLLSFMDARQARIDAARKEREEAALRRIEVQKAAEKEKHEAEMRAGKEAAAMLEASRHETALQAEEAEREYAENIERVKADMEAQKRDIRAKLDAGMDGLVTAFMDKLAQ